MKRIRILLLATLALGATNAVAAPVPTDLQSAVNESTDSTFRTTGYGYYGPRWHGGYWGARRGYGWRGYGWRRPIGYSYARRFYGPRLYGYGWHRPRWYGGFYRRGLGYRGMGWYGRRFYGGRFYGARPFRYGFARGGFYGRRSIGFGRSVGFRGRMAGGWGFGGRFGR